MIIHTVKLGDTVSSIANQYGVSIGKIIEENELKNPDKLVVGQTIVITQEDDVPLRAIIVNGYVYPNVSTEILSKTLPNLSMLTIFTYGFTTDGELVTIADEPVIEQTRAYGVAPIMLISTLTPEGTFSNALANALFNNPQAQQNLIENIVENMQEKGYWGLDVDFEFVLPEDKDNFANFLSALTTRLNSEGYPVIVALAPKTYATQPGLLYESHDYAKLGNIANFALLMTYEWGYTYGPPMPVAPINKVREVVNYAISEIPSEKLFLGIPNYGYNWKLPFVSGKSMAKSLSPVEAVELASQYNAEIKYDEVGQSPFFNYFDENGNEHIVYFEDARSIFAKLSLVNEYRLAGASYWNLMKFFPQNWLVLNSLYEITNFNLD